MGRWTQYDEDEYRLPEGMKRVGYDADTGRYYFKDKDGSLWEGPEGAQFGDMRRVSSAPSAPSENDVEVGTMRTDGYALLPADQVRWNPTRRPFRSPYRMLFPFFLIIVVCLLLVLRLVGPLAVKPAPAPTCGPGSTPSAVVAGDTCWDIAVAHGCKLDDLLKLNPTVDCDKLRPGQRLCVPL
ncbi:hypothetical protein K488DRAFT_46814 [Vararia minispora EC-137]|uniref:Uncharacterized protein n=1 Tax=Vararia minispora EC-137 TaxID=1314806 RepID=A0ACB8QQA1_9AGAM|nr:hypothetical protein K488DRAFT_46814 [Vararia minispora EC-137]